MIRFLAGQTVGAEVVDATTGGPFAGAVTVYVTGDRGVQTIGLTGGGVATLEGQGYYTYTPALSETDYDFVAFTFIGTGAVPVTTEGYTTAAAPNGPTLGLTLTASAIIEDAFLDLGIFAPGEQIPPEDAQFALRALNKLMGVLATQRLTFPFLSREVFTLVAGQGTYSIGPGGDFDTVRPMNLSGAGLLMPTTGATTGRLEVPLGVLTDDAYRNIRLKDLQSSMFTAVYYSPTYAAGLGSVTLWPVPNSTTYDLVLYRGDRMQGFATLTARYDFPPGYAEMLQFGLEKRLCRSYGKAREWGQLDEDLASSAIRFVKRQNFSPIDAVLDGTLGGRGGYIIQIGNG